MESSLPPAAHARTWTFVLLGILALALGVRLAFFLRTDSRNIYSPWYTVSGDSVEYATIARNLAQGNGFTLHEKETARRPPLYVWFLAAVFKVTDAEQYGMVRLIQILLTLVTVWAFWRIGRYLGGPLAGACAALAVALHPKLILYDLAILTESFTTLATALTVVCIIHYLETEQRAALTAAFACTALTALLRPTALPFIGFIALWAFVQSRWNARETLRRILPGIAICILILTPWTVRNYRVFGTFVPVSNVGGKTFSDGFDYPELNALGIRGGQDVAVILRDRFGATYDTDETAYSNAGYAFYKEVLTQRPLFFAYVAAKKFIYWWSPEMTFVNVQAHPFMQYALEGANWFIFALGIAWFLRVAFRMDRRMFMLFLGGLFAAYTLVHILSVPYHRYRFPVIDVYLLAFAGAALAAFAERMFRFRRASV